jgi:hypothetical protein
MLNACTADDGNANARGWATSEAIEELLAENNLQSCAPSSTTIRWTHVLSPREFTLAVDDVDIQEIEVSGQIQKKEL